MKPMDTVLSAVILSLTQGRAADNRSKQVHEGQGRGIKQLITE
jgi:hypothetical protein